MPESKFQYCNFMCPSLYGGRWLRNCFFLLRFVHMSLHTSNIILSSWEEQMGWFLLDHNNSLWFSLSPMKFVLKILSWSNNPGARWTSHLNYTTLQQNKFWQILQECVVLRVNNLGISKWQNWGYQTVFHTWGFIAVSIRNAFLMKKIWEINTI